MSILRIYFPKDFDSRYNNYFSSQRISDTVVTKETLSQDKELKFSKKLPSGTKWEDFIIKFLSKEKVHISVRSIKEELGYKDMGFYDKRNGEPDSQWGLLSILSRSGGELSWSNQDADDKFKKVKERLTQRLQSFFSIDYDPFFPYSDVKSYKIKLTLIPFEDSENTKDWRQDSLEEVGNFFEEYTSGDK